jgi:Flp pilus assembly protein TadD
LLAGSESSEQWQGFSTEHFVLYTTSPEKAAFDTLLQMERLRRFFEQIKLIDNSTKTRLQIVAFSSEKEYESYRVNPGACAFYQRTANSDFIVMQDLAPEHAEVALHEFTHYVFEHAGFKLPLWLNEGVADLYSSAIFRNRLAIIGGDAADRLPALREHALLDLNTLLAVDANSPYYREPEKMAIFYGQSWALTHMLAISRNYSPDFFSFLSMISNGASASQAFQSVYHKSLGDIGGELYAYTQRNHWSDGSVAFDPKAFNPPAKIATAQADVDLALAEIASANPHKGAAALASLQSFTAKYADKPQAEESLGYLALQENRLEDARVHFRAAVARHSDDPEVIFYLAHLNLTLGGSREEIIALLQRVLELRPEHYNARLELGFTAAKAKQFAVAAAALAGIKDLKAEHAYVVYYTLAYCYTQMTDDDTARSYAQRAQKAATNPKDVAQASNLLRFVGEATPVEVAAR